MIICRTINFYFPANNMFQKIKNKLEGMFLKFITKSIEKGIEREDLGGYSFLPIPKPEPLYIK